MHHRISVLAIALVLAACGSTPAAPSETSSPSPPTTPAPTATVVTEATTPAPTVAPTEAPDPSGPSGTIELTARFDSTPGTSYVTDVVAWSGGFLAIGSAWESEDHVTAEMPAMWRSLDGLSWDAHPVQLGVDDVTLVGVVERADGRLLLVGVVPGSGGVPDSSEPRNVAWTSQDAIRWEPVELPLSEEARVDALAHGPRGYVLSAQTPYTEFDPNADQTPGELWYSVDGIDWTKTYEGAVGVVAGDEGFVAIQSARAAGPSGVVASADGRTWYASAVVGAPLLDVASLGGDWLATAYGGDPATIRVLHSENGLDWTAVLDVNDLTGPDGPKTGRGLNEPAINDAFLAGGRDLAFLMLGNNHCCAQMGWTYGIWVTTDGVTWAQATSDSALVSSVAASADVTVLGGHLGRGEEAAFWVAR
jgi:hypothetical protein